MSQICGRWSLLPEAKLVAGADEYAKAGDAWEIGSLEAAHLGLCARWLPLTSV